MLCFYLHSPLWHTNSPEHKQLDEQKPFKLPEFSGQLNKKKFRIKVQMFSN